jgi:hypothetical protein
MTWGLKSLGSFAMEIDTCRNKDTGVRSSAALVAQVM